MEMTRTDGDELIADYVNCLMSLDANSRSVEHSNPPLLAISVPTDFAQSSVLQDQPESKDFDQVCVEETKLEPSLGMEFESDEAAKTFYNEYARRLGFPFRVGRSRRSKGTEEVLIMKRFVCSKEGVYQKKPSSEGSRKRERISMREGCKAMMEVIRDGDRWVASKLEKAHNHHLGTCTRVGYLRSRGFIDASDKANFIVSDTLSVIRQNAFGHDGDAQGLLDYFKRMQAENPAFFYAIQSDSNSCVTNACWAYAKARTDYKHFGDAVTFDTTYKKNKYMMPFVTFSGVNNHLQTVIFGCGLLIEETEFSFTWLFETWLEAMGGLPPLSFITDQNRAMAVATSRAFPSACHRFCKWLIFSRTKQKISHLYSAHPTLKAELEDCVNESESIRGFETSWASIIDKFDLMKNAWLQGLFNIRHRWVPVYLKENFFAEMSSTQKLDTMNDFYKKHFNTKTSLKIFLTQFDLAIERRYADEVQADLNTIGTKPTLKTASPIEKQAALIYTQAVFAKFQEEFVESFGCNINKPNDDNTGKFNVTRDDDVFEAFTVTYNGSKSIASCSCKHFEFSGILCRHVIGVFLMVDHRILTNDYFLRRWTINPIGGELFDECSDDIKEACHASVSTRFTDLCQIAMKFAEKGAKSMEMYKSAKDALNKVFVGVLAYEKNGLSGEHRDSININEEIPIDDDGMNAQSMDDPERKVTNFLGQLLGSSWSPM